MSTSIVTIRQALNRAFFEEMRRDENVFLMGEDVAEYDGAYKVTQGLLKEFGPKRVIDTPISEAGFAGIGIGAAMKGLRPIVEFMTWNFGMQAFDQIVNTAAKTHYMSGGTIKCPAVFRGPNGPAARVAAQHSQCLASTFANFTGLRIVMPSTPTNYYGLLKSSIRSDDPIIFLENEVLYGHKGELADEEFVTPLNKAHIVQEGTDLTVISYGKALHTTLAGCKDLPYSIEIIDLQTLKPFDEEAIIKSVSKTHRVLIVEESLPFASIASELITWIISNLWNMLDVQPRKVSGLDVPLPYAPNLEKMSIPQPENIANAIYEIMSE